MRKKQYWSALGASLGIMLLILDSRSALLGGTEGVELCIKTVIPSLFPFLILTMAVTDNLYGTTLPWLRPIGKCFGMPKGSEGLLIPAFLGGYPAGAQAIGRAYRKGQLSQRDAEKLLTFCNNPGPAFLFGLVGTMFADNSTVWLLWGIQIFSSWLVAGLFGDASDPCISDHTVKARSEDILPRSLRVMAQICGWIVIFRVLIAFLDRWCLWLLPIRLRVLLYGLLELTNGCCQLSLIEDAECRLVLCAGMLSFGGLCVGMQTVSVLDGISARPYFIGKLLQTVFCLLLTYGYVWGMLPFMVTLCLIFLLRMIFFRFYSRNPVVYGV